MPMSAYTIGDAPSQEGFFGPLTSFLEHLLAAVAPDVTTSFLWRLVGMYFCAVRKTPRRRDRAVDRLLCTLPSTLSNTLLDQDVRPAGGDGAAPPARTLKSSTR
ncbi:hypothetical protein N7516_004708 [Penicillium verrucosum]|uniref:uncharacterized protein n=1 Tax=Penicillium verrucosum TaxID=60171 RepID=UPI00254561C2|nr:uncharacterized protein N7516_004708 [Penicillium verrucosum]KAJ5944540.1 hypothetical protein N7516_004708 [Penicillium verrucosum]